MTHVLLLRCLQNAVVLLQAQMGADATGVSMKRSPLTGESVVSFVKRGCPLLVAYDRNPNTHLPEEAGGAHAHWGLVRGFARRLTGFSPKPSGDSSAASNGDECGGLVVLLTHTMSQRPLVCPFSALARSNGQLREPKQGNRFVLPAAGMDLSGSLIAPVL